MKRQFLALFLTGLLIPSLVCGSYAIYIGKNLTTDGSVFIGGSGDEVSSHWLEIVPARDHIAGLLQWCAVLAAWGMLPFMLWR